MNLNVVLMRLKCIINGAMHVLTNFDCCPLNTSSSSSKRDCFSLSVRIILRPFSLASTRSDLLSSRSRWDFSVSSRRFAKAVFSSWVILSSISSSEMRLTAWWLADRSLVLTEFSEVFSSDASCSCIEKNWGKNIKITRFFYEQILRLCLLFIGCLWLNGVMKS